MTSAVRARLRAPSDIPWCAFPHPSQGCCPLSSLSLRTNLKVGVTRQGDSGAWLKESKYQRNHYKAKKGMDIGEVKVRDQWVVGCF